MVSSDPTSPSIKTERSDIPFSPKKVTTWPAEQDTKRGIRQEVTKCQMSAGNLGLPTGIMGFTNVPLPVYPGPTYYILNAK